MLAKSLSTKNYHYFYVVSLCMYKELLLPLWNAYTMEIMTTNNLLASCIVSVSWQRTLETLQQLVLIILFRLDPQKKK
jgi:hypothetical protein